MPLRRREEATAQPSMAMRAAAVNLAVVLRHNFDFQGMPAPGDKGKAPADGDGAPPNPYATPEGRLRWSELWLLCCNLPAIQLQPALAASCPRCASHSLPMPRPLACRSPARAVPVARAGRRLQRAV